MEIVHAVNGILKMLIIDKVSTTLATRLLKNDTIRARLQKREIKISNIGAGKTALLYFKTFSDIMILLSKGGCNE